MKERPILFNGAMVRAILAGQKTQTRRVVKPCKDREFGCNLMPHEIAGEINNGNFINSPYGQLRDQLWVRETFKFIAHCEIKNGRGDMRYGYAYQADSATVWQDEPTTIYDQVEFQPEPGMQFKPMPWKPSIHMPRKASRIMLEITDVRIERLQGISESDARAEGCACVDEFSGREVLCPITCNAGSYRLGYRALWESINGRDSWHANPWVWVISFKRVEQ